MQTKSLLKVKKDMLHILFYQLLVIIGLVCLFCSVKGMQHGLSVLVGALSYWLSTVFFAWIISAKIDVRAGISFVPVLMAGESAKLVLCGTLFVICIKYLPIELISAVIGLVGAIVAFWIASAACLIKKERKREAVA